MEAASRNAHIVEEPQFDRKIIMTEIDIENQKENIVSVPGQEVSVSLKNEASSFESFKIIFYKLHPLTSRSPL